MFDEKEIENYVRRLNEMFSPGEVLLITESYWNNKYSSKAYTDEIFNLARKGLYGSILFKYDHKAFNQKVFELIINKYI